MNKQDIINKVAEQEGITKAAAKGAVDAVFEIIAAELENGEQVSIPNFGIFKTATQAARTTAFGNTPEKRVPKFKASSVLKKRIAG